MNTVNTVIYARYSSDNQREESIEGQLRECKEYADKNNMTIVGTYIDRALSAKTDDRPQFQKMIKDSNTHKFEIVLVWKLDRFSRNRYDSAFYKRKLSQNRVKVVSATEPISNAPEGIMLESLLEGMAEYYSAELAEKVTRGHKENALKGMFNGGVVPFGYVIDEQMHYQIDPDKAPIVKEVFQRYADGEQIKDLCESLNARGIYTSYGRPFTKSSFQNLLKNRRYLGEYRYKDIVTPGAIPALVDPDVFEKVQKRSSQNKRAPARTKADEVFMLTTKAFCGECGAMVVGDSGQSHTGMRHYYYKCGRHKREGKSKCHLQAIRKEVLERFVIRLTARYVLRDDVIDKIADTVVSYTAEENKTLPVMRAQLKEVNKKINNLIAAIEQGIVTPTTQKRLNELEEQQNSLEISILQEEIAKPTLTREQVVFWIEQFKSMNTSDPAVCKDLIDCFVNSIYIFPKKIKIIFYYREGDRPVSFSEARGSDIKRNGSPNESKCEPVYYIFVDGTFGICVMRDGQ